MICKEIKKWMKFFVYNMFILGNLWIVKMRLIVDGREVVVNEFNLVVKYDLILW